MYSRPSCAAILIASLFWPGLAVAEEGERVSGTSVTMIAPLNFEPATGFTGYVEPETVSSIAVNEVPRPVAKVRKIMTAENFAKRGVIFVDKETVELADTTALLIRLAQPVQGVVFDKQILLLGDDSKSVVIIATYPHDFAEDQGPVMRAALLSVRWSPGARRDIYEGLGFRISETPQLKITNRISNMLLLARPEAEEERGPGKPMLIVETTDNHLGSTALLVAAQGQLMSMANISDVGDLQARESSIDGMRAYELVASANHEKTGADVLVYQMMAVSDGTIFVISGYVEKAHADIYLPQFQAVAMSLQRTR